MTTAVETRFLIAGGSTTILVGSLLYWLLQVRPLDLELSRLQTQIVAEQQAKEAAQRSFELEKAKMVAATAEIQRLRLFDLRQETDFDRVFGSRSNVGLLAFTEVFQQNNISIESLVPGNIEQRPIVAQGSLQGGVLRRRYRIHGSGLYQNLIKAFEGIKSFPPAVDIERYSFKYQGVEGTQARVSFDMTLGFNFLVSTLQLAAASASAQATPSVAFEPLDDFVPTPGSNEASASVDGLLSVPVPGAPQNMIQNLQQLAPAQQGARIGWLAPADLPTMSWLGEAHEHVRAARLSNSRGWAAEEGYLIPSRVSLNPRSSTLPSLALANWWGWLDPVAIAAPATGSLPPTPAPYLFNVGRKTTLGRAEPFLPLAGAVLKKIAPLAPPIATLPTVNLLPPALIPEDPPPPAVLLAVLLSDDKPANALLQYGGTRALVHQGSVLEGGDQVVAIGRNFVMIRHKKALRRVELRSIGSAPSASSPVSAATSKEPSITLEQKRPLSTNAPTPPLPSVPQAPRLPN